jgi:hypothetical protein
LKHGPVRDAAAESAFGPFDPASPNVTLTKNPSRAGCTVPVQLFLSGPVYFMKAGEYCSCKAAPHQSTTVPQLARPTKQRNSQRDCSEKKARVPAEHGRSLVSIGEIIGSIFPSLLRPPAPGGPACMPASFTRGRGGSAGSKRRQPRRGHLPHHPG